jgi:hypothetical protein
LCRCCSARKPPASWKQSARDFPNWPDDNVARALHRGFSVWGQSIRVLLDCRRV